MQIDDHEGHLESNDRWRIGRAQLFQGSINKFALKRIK
jgi:hypothetical protein